MTTDVWDDSRERGRGPVGSSMSDDDADGADGGAVRARGVARGQDGCMKEGPPMARFYVHGVLMYAYSDGMVMMGGDELRSWFADVGADAARAVARGAPAQAGPISTRDSEGPGGPRGTGSNSMVAAAAAADALAADRRPPPGLEAEVPRAVQQCASAPRPDPARAGAASGAALGSTATAAAPTSPVASVASELQLLSEIFASRQQVGELALQQVRASDQQVQLMQQLTQLVQNQLAHIGMLTEAIEGMREADKERGDELRQLRAMVAAQQQQLGAGALLWRSDPGFLAELPAGSSVEGRDEAQEAAPVLAATNGAPAACRRHEGETGERAAAPLRILCGEHCGKKIGEAFEAATVEVSAGSSGAATKEESADSGVLHGATAVLRLEGLQAGEAAASQTGEAELMAQRSPLPAQVEAKPAWLVKSPTATVADRQLATFSFKVPGSLPPAQYCGSRHPELSSVLSALKTRAQGEPTGRGRSQGPSTGRPPGGPAAFRLPLPPATWLRRPYDRGDYSLLRSLLGEIEADPLTPRGRGTW